MQICRTVLRAALTEAVDEGLIPRSPAARVGLPRTVAKPVRVKETETWTADEVDRFLEATASHRWAVAFRVSLLYGLRRSKMLALKWKNLEVSAGTLKIEESIVATRTGAEWGNAKNERSRRTIPIDDETMRAFARRRAEQAAEPLVAGEEWEDNDLIVATRSGPLVLPRSNDRALERFVESAELPRLTSHGLRHMAATHMVQQASDLGVLRAIADILGHSPEMLMNTYAHALPNSQQAIVDRIGRRSE